ncbi:undecaprenyldiphospho-muramoylpentapeptide beta-N-acetylglucosaminyltransferase [Algoriphagus halophytocola]|uniref:UDP-N-acetylglucosamine--N-acetylmuramyl-(pentapeptide) pyrophosphoryl-undecaprenol N-acetylglucosamine transferase n=1 Tax=Algoriphagus halophytocola TaxID=2991499 RepID=A0ABY6MBR6_9BACT|nr:MULTISPECIES: undecaprenyldiphospho-muramoylpentapeptide beta-N-acetylglucosaminyltransferase [unclassified Algoriphagus]UZD21072.1 undecaprenyldiphospho-muramoylpentapeptide beta-N-acetylglucosaminyltransferase [Algoriphagus sp. TR-M5]WBL42238.1 undecaprenyldiphospho-muramoylpentapeptide beta-N-acetylglucosaminyltransferase [Algoriphagus sp. TR-M9]
MISGGGTGGHIYPAIAIANAWREKYPSSKILFVGASGKMEMQKVPDAGYKIKGLPVAGLQRSFSLENLKFPFKLLSSLMKASKIVSDFRPDVVVGVGGYASGPVLFAAQRKGIPTLVQEQNSYAGLTNKILAKRAKKICVAYPDMDRFFPADRISYTGNPVRKDILDLAGKREKAITHFALEAEKKTLLVLGGSLGARTLNQAVLNDMAKLDEAGYQVIWQCGKYYYKEMKKKTQEAGFSCIHLREFIREMDLAYAAADVIVSRAGALSVSELSLVGKPVIFIPSPNVAEDHQTKNAMAYVQHDAAWLLKDAEAIGQLENKVDLLMKDAKVSGILGENIKKLAKPNAAIAIVEEIEGLIA